MLYDVFQWDGNSSKVPSHGGSGQPSNIWFLEPIGVQIANRLIISSAVFAQHVVVSDARTYRSHYVKACIATGFI